MILTFYIWICVVHCVHQDKQGFFPGGPPFRKNFANSPPPSDACPRFWTKACPPPPPAEVRSRKFEKFKYIFVSNLTTFKLNSTLKSCISCLKLQKNSLILH